MFIYIAESLDPQDRASVITKWNRKHRFHPLIRAAVGDLRRKVLVRPGFTWTEFQAALHEFISWHETVAQNNPGEIIVLWLSVHGAPSKVGVRCGDGSQHSMKEVLGTFFRKLRPNVVLLQSICWGGYPAITHVMNNGQYGPCLIFGPTIEVDVSALHHAEGETLKFLAARPNPSPASLRDHLNSVNSWGARTHKGHNSFYRVWYWSESPHRPARYPGSTNAARMKRITT